MILLMVLILMVIILACSGIAWGGIHREKDGYCWSQDCGRE